MSCEIDWEEQWACHAPEFKDGMATISLPANQKISLLPGPGFGDYSHPTTQLMIELMAPYVQSKTIFDIGCGSGILSVAAGKLGAQKMHICDIDPAALEHTKKNIHLNHFQLENGPFTEKPVIFMNMIHTEQAIAWKDHKTSFETLITSGILTSQENSYLEFANKQNWRLIEKKEKQGWLGCIFKENL